MHLFIKRNHIRQVSLTVLKFYTYLTLYYPYDMMNP